MYYVYLSHYVLGCIMCILVIMCWTQMKHKCIMCILVIMCWDLTAEIKLLCAFQSLLLMHIILCAIMCQYVRLCAF